MGWSQFSETLEVVAATKPEKPLPPTTAIDQIFVRISFIDPVMNSSPVNAYKIFIANSDGAFAEDLVYCNGAS